MSELFRHLPAIHLLLESPDLSQALQRYSHEVVRDACREMLDGLRAKIAAGRVGSDDLAQACGQLPNDILSHLEEQAATAYPTVVNATGVLLHTNLGRAPLGPSSAADEGYLALEYDLHSGRRGQRLAPLRERISAACGAEWAVMVNNNAASLLLILAGWAKDREVIVSRSQLIEIGGSFRLPSVMASAGCRLVEVGCTNRTHLRDYEAAIGPETGGLMVVHQSNFRIVGFTTLPEIQELAELAHRRELPLIVDQGSGCLHDLRRWGMPPEATVSELLENGADIVCFSGDKLIGGPQAGIIVGRRQWVEPLGRHPLYRALRPDKTALTTLDRVLEAHRTGHLEQIPLYALLEETEEHLKRRAGRIGRNLRRDGVPARVLSTRAALGGGTTPDETMPSFGLAMAGGSALADLLRQQSQPVIARIEDDEVVLDLKSVPRNLDRSLTTSVLEAYKKLQASQEMGA